MEIILLRTNTQKRTPLCRYLAHSQKHVLVQLQDTPHVKENEQAH